MDTVQKIKILAEKITPSRFEKMLHALDFRTRRLTVVLEDIFQSHNAAAVLRNCDAFGVQDIRVIENRYKLKISSDVDMGVSKWQTLHVHSCHSAAFVKAGMGRGKAFLGGELENTRRALLDLKAQGFVLAASSLSSSSVSLDDVPVDKPLALMIGTELTGLTPVAHELADVVFSVPMLGFAQSFNLSVFSALCLEKLSSKMRAHSDLWKMSDDEKNQLLLDWLRISVSNSDFYIAD